MDPTARPCAVTVAAIVQQAERFLLVEEHIDRQRVLNQPAGHVEAGETLLAAVVRETREETAWRFSPTSFIGAYRWTHPHTGQCTLRFAFTGSVDDHDPDQPLDAGILGTCWLSRGELAACVTRHRSPLVMRCVDDYLNQPQQPLAAIATLDRTSAAGFPAVTVGPA
jgi:NADH pyrophosphatase NudC (nudix superfamily)